MGVLKKNKNNDLFEHSEHYVYVIPL